MNVKDIKVQAQLHVSRQIQLQYVLKFMNEAINNLAIEHDTACKREFMTIKADKNIWYDLPDDCLGIKECTYYGEKYNNYRANHGQIKFGDTGDFEIGYLRYPKMVENETEVPDINGAYHYCLALFVASREIQRLFGDENSDSMRLMQEYYTSKENVNLRLSRMKRTARFVGSPEWR